MAFLTIVMLEPEGVLTMETTSKFEASLPVLLSWCSIKNDYKTLAGLESVSAAEKYPVINEDEHDYQVHTYTIF